MNTRCPAARSARIALTALCGNIFVPSSISVPSTSKKKSFFCMNIYCAADSVAAAPLVSVPAALSAAAVSATLFACAIIKFATFR